MPAQKRLRIDHNPLSGLTLLRRRALLRLALALRDPPLGIPQSRLASFRRAQLLGQLITPSVAVKLASRRSVFSASRKISSAISRYERF